MKHYHHKILFFTTALISSVLLAGCTPQASQNQEPSAADTTPVAPLDTVSDTPSVVKTPGTFQDYSQSEVESSVAMGNTTVLFFHAEWCSTCRAAEKDIVSRMDSIPENVKIFKVDYDTEAELVQQYEIVNQHTFVVLDENMNISSKWLGGSLDEIIERI